MKKLLKWAGIGLVVLIVIGAVAGGGKTEPEKVGLGSQESTTQPSEETRFKVGEQIKMGNMILTVNKVERSQGSQYTKPSEGNEWVNLNVTLENTGSDQEYITTLGQMFIVDGEGNQYQIAVTNKGMENVNNSLDGAVVAKAKKTGWVGFEVPKTAQGLTFRYNASFWNDKAILVELN